MKRVLVSNIPLDAYISGWVEVPDETDVKDEEKLQEAIARALLDHGFKEVGVPENHEMNDGLVKTGWEFTVEEIQ